MYHYYEQHNVAKNCMFLHSLQKTHIRKKTIYIQLVLLHRSHAVKLKFLSCEKHLKRFYHCKLRIQNPNAFIVIPRGKKPLIFVPHLYRILYVVLSGCSGIKTDYILDALCSAMHALFFIAQW